MEKIVSAQIGGPLHRKKWQKWGIIIFFNNLHVYFLSERLEDVPHQKRGRKLWKRENRRVSMRDWIELVG